MAVRSARGGLNVVLVNHNDHLEHAIPHDPATRQTRQRHHNSRVYFLGSHALFDQLADPATSRRPAFRNAMPLCPHPGQQAELPHPIHHRRPKW
ncbi:MAG TPA: hypothetical protein DIT64_12085 [Verrucomicrobiales bacterium]|nr:hypothetical protein [Verrucomicrobiales bacterium]HCN77795.1 hypothetical protein [Verrucomicrobiales bacterium]